MSIKFSLICECSAKFEGWFPSNKDYEKQLADGHLTCPICDSKNVRKDIMSPNIKSKSTKRKKQSKMEMKGTQIVMAGRARTLLKQLESYVKTNFQDVGKSFAKEARKAQRGERDQEFYGTATKKEAKELLNEGIDLFHVPEVKDN